MARKKERTNCNNCPDRYLGCHADCDIDKRQKARRQMIAEGRRREQDEYICYVREAVHRMSGKKRGEK